MIFNENLFLYVISALALFIIILGIWIWLLERRIKKILGSREAKDLEEAVLDTYKRLKSLEDFREGALRDLDNKERRLQRSLQAVETIRFNPFKGTGDGGNQSFSSAFLNETGSGVILTGIYSRERISIYAKPIKEFRAEFELSEEEKGALEKAKHSIK